MPRDFLRRLSRLLALAGGSFGESVLAKTRFRPRDFGWLRHSRCPRRVGGGDGAVAAVSDTSSGPEKTGGRHVFPATAESRDGSREDYKARSIFGLPRTGQRPRF